MKVKLFLKDKAKANELVALKGYSQPSLAEAARTSTSYINKILNGNAQPGPELAGDICGVLGVAIEDLFYAQSVASSTQDGVEETQEEDTLCE
jgi:transcriptional regulator with XRE-family HTH domain